jgi:hypothetical protein
VHQAQHRDGIPLHHRTVVVAAARAVMTEAILSAIKDLVDRYGDRIALAGGE